MSLPVLKVVHSEKDLSQFIQFPMKLYRDNPNFVPPLIQEEKNIWNSKENPALLYSEFRLYMVVSGDEVLGRVAVIINRKEEEELGIRKVRFGWLDFVDDAKVSKMLMQAVIDFAKENKIRKCF